MNIPYDKIGTDTAKEQRKLQIAQAKDDEQEILGKFIQSEHSKLMDKTKYNYALFNLMMQVHSFKEYADLPPIEGMRKMYMTLIPHIERMCKERNFLLDYVSTLEQGNKPTALQDIRLKEIRELMDVQSMAADLLNKVSQAARKRAKQKLYTPKPEIKI